MLKQVGSCSFVVIITIATVIVKVIIIITIEALLIIISLHCLKQGITIANQIAYLGFDCSSKTLRNQ